MTDVQALMQAARDAAAEKRFGDAVAAANGVLARHPRAIGALRMLAWSQLRLEDDRALATFEQCAEIDPEDDLAEIGRGMCLERRGEHEAATAAYIRAWELEPSSLPTRRAVARLAGGLPDSLLADGIGLLRQGRYDVAAQVLRHACAQKPPDAAPLLALATALWHLGGTQQAHNLAVSVLTRHPHNVKALLFQAAVELRQGRMLRTRELLARAEEVDPGLVVYAELVRATDLESALDRPQAAWSPQALAR